MYRHSNAVWIKAYWDGQDERWASSSGRWEGRKDQTARWVDAGYEGEGRAWRYPPADLSNQQVGGDDQRWRDESRSRRNRQ